MRRRSRACGACLGRLGGPAGARAPTPACCGGPDNLLTRRPRPQFYADTTVWDAVPSITNDLLLVGGEEDLIVPPQNVRAIAERVPTPWLVIFKEAGHAAMWQYPEEFLSLVDTFLSFPVE